MPIQEDGPLRMLTANRVGAADRVRSMVPAERPSGCNHNVASVYVFMAVCTDTEQFSLTRMGSHLGILGA